MAGMDMKDMMGGAPAAGAKLAAVDALPAGAALQPLAALHNESTRAGLFRAKLVAAPVKVPLLAGRAPTEFWAYNGTLPGPLIEVMEGDVVEIHFENHLPQPTTVHWHGLPVPSDQDGNPHDAVAPGAQRTYRFTLPKGSAGTYLLVPPAPAWPYARAGLPWPGRDHCGACQDRPAARHARAAIGVQ
jgi:bilirubin oxidase